MGFECSISRNHSFKGKAPVGNTPDKTCLKRDLARKLADYRITASPLNPEFRFEDLLSKVNECRVVKANSRRQVYHLQTTAGGYFLKRSTLVRAKDRLRHFILPRRRWAEWRNLHRLRQAQVPAARPLLKGLQKIPSSQFLLCIDRTGIGGAYTHEFF